MRDLLLFLGSLAGMMLGFYMLLRPTPHTPIFVKGDCITINANHEFLSNEPQAIEVILEVGKENYLVAEYYPSMNEFYPTLSEHNIRWEDQNFRKIECPKGVLERLKK